MFKDINGNDLEIHLIHRSVVQVGEDQISKSSAIDYYLLQRIDLNLNTSICIKESYLSILIDKNFQTGSFSE